MALDRNFAHQLPFVDHRFECLLKSMLHWPVSVQLKKLSKEEQSSYLVACGKRAGEAWLVLGAGWAVMAHELELKENLCVRSHPLAGECSDLSEL